MSASDAAPDHAVVRALHCGRGAVDVSNALAEVECSVGSRLDAIDGEQVTVGVLVAVSTAVTDESALHIKAGGSNGGGEWSG